MITQCLAELRILSGSVQLDLLTLLLLFLWPDSGHFGIQLLLQNCNKWTLISRWERVSKTKRCMRISKYSVGSHNTKLLHGTELYKIWVVSIFIHGSHLSDCTVNSLWTVCVFHHSSTAVVCMENLVFSKYLDIFSSLIWWAHVLLKMYVVKQLSVSNVEMVKEAQPLLTEQLQSLDHSWKYCTWRWSKGSYIKYPRYLLTY